MNETIDIEKIIKKAHIFGFNTKVINMLINANISFDKTSVKKLQKTIDSIYNIEVDSQLSKK
jgi:hypothetical protein